MSRKFKPVDGGLNATVAEDSSGTIELNGGNGGDSGSGGGALTIDPGSLDGTGTGESGGEQPKKRRGRKAGQTKKKNVPLNVNAIEFAISSIHKLMAMRFKTELLLLDPEESKALAEAIADVTNYYGVGALGVWGQLAVVSGGIYGPRIGLMVAAKYAG